MTLDQPKASRAPEGFHRRKTLAAFDLLAPQRIAQQLKIAILLAIVISVVYAIGLLIDLTKPPLPNSPLSFIRLIQIPFPAIWHISEVIVLVGWGAAALAGVLGLIWARVGAAHGAAARACQLVVLAALFLPFAIFPFATVFGNEGYALLCVPTTAFALWLVRRMQPHRKLPLHIVFMGFGWGALIAAGFSIAMTSRFAHYAANVFLEFDLFDLEGMQTRLFTSAALNNAVSSELGKIVGIALLFMLFRHHFDDIVSGIVIGAAVGIGANFIESIQVMAASDATLFNVGGPASQYWSHQVLGLMTSHVALGALAGAGFGAARQLQGVGQRWIAVLCGCGTAMAGHFASDVIRIQFLLPRTRWAKESPWFETLAIEALLIAVTTGPFVVMYLILLRRGIRNQAAGLSAQIRAEALSGSGAITSTEIPIIRRSAARFFIRVDTLRSSTLPEFRHIRKLQAAQLDLVTSRWHRVRGETDPKSPDESVHRERVLVLKRQHAHPDPPSTPNATE